MLHPDRADLANPDSGLARSDRHEVVMGTSIMRSHFVESNDFDVHPVLSIKYLLTSDGVKAYHAIILVRGTK